MRLVTLFAASALLMSPALAVGHGNHGGSSGKGDRFSKADSNGDGVISRDEFLALAAERFSKMDADGNGTLSKDEMRPRRGKRGNQAGGNQSGGRNSSQQRSTYGR